MKLICLLCKKISLSKTLSSRNFRMKYNLAAGGGVGWGGRNPCLINSNYFKKKSEASFLFAYWQCVIKVIGTDVNNLSGVLECTLF